MGKCWFSHSPNLTFSRSSYRFYHSIRFRELVVSKFPTFIHSNCSDWYLYMHGINFQYCWHSCAYEIAFHYIALEIIQFTHFNQIMSCVTCCMYASIHVYLCMRCEVILHSCCHHTISIQIQHCWQFYA